MKKQYLNPSMTLLPVDSCDVIATSGVQKKYHDDAKSYGEVWGE